MSVPQLPIDIFNRDFNYQKPALFLGDKMGLIEEINQHYPDILALYDRLVAMSWHRDEFDYKPCNAEFKSCSKNIYDMMLLNLRYQWALDSVVSRSISGTVHPFVSSSELHALWTRVAENECVTGDHEVLTPSGWKSIDTITMDDRVAQWHYDNQTIDFVHPEQLISKPFEGEMYAFTDENDAIIQITTPNHRMPILHPDHLNTDEPSYLTSREVNYHGTNALPIAGFLSSSDQGMTALERLYVAVYTSGELCSERDDHNCIKPHYFFILDDQDKIDRLHHLCDLSKLVFVEEHDNRPQGKRMFYVYLPKVYYNWEAKTLDWFEFDRISYEWSLDFLNELKFWSSDKASLSYAYSVRDESAAEKVATLAHLTGRKGQIVKQDADTYQVSFKDNICVIGKNIEKSKVPYSGKVYCMTVPSSYFLVRHDGKVSVTGNCLHSHTYSAIVRNSFDNPHEVLEDTLSIDPIFDRLAVVTTWLDRIYERSNRYALKEAENDQDTYNHIFMYVVILLCIERIQFMASFAVTFAIAEMGMFLPIASAVKKIMDDELTIHVEADLAILKHELSTDRGQAALEHLRYDIKDLIDAVVDAECLWVDYLFSEGRELVGLTPEILKQWVRYCAGDVFDALHIDPFFNIPTTNPIPYMDIWIRNDHQASPQEEKTAAYFIGMVKDDSTGQQFDIDLD